MKRKLNPRHRRSEGVERARAHEVAIAALQFLAADADRLAGFLAATGLTAESLREAAAAPDFWAGVMDHVASNETILVGLARELEVEPETVLDGWRTASGSEPG